MEVRLTHFAKRFFTRVSVSPLRLLSYILHATGLEHLYKPRFIRHAALFELTDEVIEKLPKYCNTMTGARNDPMNLIFVAREADLKRTFRRAKWHRANPASPVHIAYGLLMALLKRSYKTGPFAPLYVNIALQDLAYQRSAKEQSFRERRHLRIWRTGIIISDGRRVWLGACSRENGMKLGWALPFWSHKLDPNLDLERKSVVKNLETYGAVQLKTVQLSDVVAKGQPRKNAFGSPYYTDGQAVVVEL